MKNLILPVAGQSSRYPNMRPKWLITMPDGKLMIEKSVSDFILLILKYLFIFFLNSKYVNKNIEIITPVIIKNFFELKIELIFSSNVFVLVFEFFLFTKLIVFISSELDKISKLSLELTM